MPKAARKRSSAQSKKSVIPTKLKQETVPDKILVGKRTTSVIDNDTAKKTKTTNDSKTVITKNDTSQASETSGNGEGDVALSRGQRKRLAKREKYLKRERMVMSSLKLKKQDEQAKRIDGLDALKEALLETVSDKPATSPEKSQPAQVVRSNKGKRSIVHKEVEHMKLVLEHPAFKANPLAAIHEHLKNTTRQQTEEEPKPVPVKAKPKKKKSRFRATRMKNR